MQVCDECGRDLHEGQGRLCDDGTFQCSRCRKVTGAIVISGDMAAVPDPAFDHKRPPSPQAIRQDDPVLAKHGREPMLEETTSKQKTAISKPKVAISNPKTATSKPKKATSKPSPTRKPKTSPADENVIDTARNVFEPKQRKNADRLGDHTASEVRGAMVACVDAQNASEMLAKKEATHTAKNADAFGSASDMRTWGRARDVDELIHGERSSYPAMSMPDYVASKKSSSQIAALNACLDAMSKLIHALPNEGSVDIADAIGEAALALNVMCSKRGLSFDQCVMTMLHAEAEKASIRSRKGIQA